MEERLLMRGMVFGGFKKCLYPAPKFDSDSERRFSIILEDDADVVKWLKPPQDLLKIYYADEDNYNSDFIVETANARYLREIKRATAADPSLVQKAKVAIQWGERASIVSDRAWKYVILPHDVI